MSTFPSTPIGFPDLEAVVRAWSLSMESPEFLGSGTWHEFSRPAAENEIDEAERKLGRSLPDSFRALYRFSNGMSLLGGNLNIVPLESKGQFGGLVTKSDDLRRCEWPIPNELVVFGDNGGEELFGIWLARDVPLKAPRPIIGVGEISEPDCLAVYGTDLPRFLRAWCAFYLMYADEPCPALDALGLPMDIRGGQRDSAKAFAACFAWADPGLPHIPPKPYEQRLSPDDIRKMYPAP